MNPDNKKYVNRVQNFATDPPLQVTLRELQLIVSNPRFWIGFGAVMALLTITGPFGTLTSMDVPTRLVYWAVICLSTYFVGAAVSILVAATLVKRNVAERMAWLAGGLAAGPPVGTAAWFISTAVFNVDIASRRSFPEFIAYTTIISVMVVVLTVMISRRKWSPQQNDNKKIHSAFFNRLPVHLGKELLSLEAQDHYINVKTVKGSELILLRLGDAQKELASFPGLRVHRSWWVAIDAIEKVTRTKGRTDLLLKDGSTIPVSRSYIKPLDEAGIK